MLTEAQKVYMNGLAHLEKKRAEGLSEEEEDRLLDNLDVLWYAMTSSEIAGVQTLSLEEYEQEAEAGKQDCDQDQREDDHHGD
jgi:hypothetical protein